MPQDNELLCVSANGKSVVFDPVSSHTATHFKDAPGLRGLVEKLLVGMSLKENLIAKDFDMGKTIGNTDVVEIDETDEVVYAMRKNREDQGYVPFTKSRTTQPCSFVSVYLVKKDDQVYELASTWIGEFESPSFPQMQNATTDSAPYWNKHAFVWGSQEIIPGSVIAKCPW